MKYVDEAALDAVTSENYATEWGTQSGTGYTTSHEDSWTSGDTKRISLILDTNIKNFSLA